MADLNHVRRALRDRLDALVLSPVLPIAWPEPTETFVPPSGPYLVAKLLFNRPRFEGMSASDGVLDQGLLQVDVVWPKNQGDAGAIDVAKAIRAHFTVDPALALFHGGTKTKITGQPYLSGPFSEDADLRVPVTVPWTAS